MIKHKDVNGWLVFLTFLILTYVFASWFIFSFGCGFGSRNFVEYTVIFALPLGYLFENITTTSKTKKILIVTLLSLMVVFNLRLVYTYNHCFNGGDWDFQEYVSFVTKIRKYHQTLKLDGQQNMTHENEYSNTLKIPAEKIHNLKFKEAIIRSRVALDDKNSEAMLVLSVENPDSVVYWNAIKLKEQIPDRKLHKMQTVVGEFNLPVPFPPNSTVSAFIWNINRESLSLSKLEISLE